MEVDPIAREFSPGQYLFATDVIRLHHDSKSFPVVWFGWSVGKNLLINNFPFVNTYYAYLTGLYANAPLFISNPLFNFSLF